MSGVKQGEFAEVVPVLAPNGPQGATRPSPFAEVVEVADEVVDEAEAAAKEAEAEAERLAQEAQAEADKLAEEAKTDVEDELHKLEGDGPTEDEAKELHPAGQGTAPEGVEP